MDIAALILWMCTAGAGVYLLTTVIAARRREPRAPAAGPATGAGPGPGPAVPPPIPRVRVTTGPGDHPLLEFSHPALAIAGLGCWLAFVASRYPLFAWVAFGILLTAIGAGIRWLASHARAARGDGGTGGRRPPGAPVHLIAIHGLAAASTLVLAMLTVLTLSHI